MVVAACLAALARGRAISRSPWPVGRFLFRFGLVLAEVDRITIVEGPEITGIRVTSRPMDRGGECDVFVTVSFADRKETLRVRGIDSDVPQAQLDELRGHRWQTLVGYRHAVPTAQGPTPAPRSRKTLVGSVAASLLVAFLTFVVFLPCHWMWRASASDSFQLWVETSDLFPWTRPWVSPSIDRRMRAIEHSIRSEVREPYRGALLRWIGGAAQGRLGRIRTASFCEIWETDREAVRAFAMAHGDPGAADRRLRWWMLESGWTVESGTPLAGVIPENAFAWYGESLPAVAVGLRCRVTPDRMVEVDGEQIVALTLHARWTLTTPDGEQLETLVEVAPPTDAEFQAVDRPGRAALDSFATEHLERELLDALRRRIRVADAHGDARDPRARQ